MLSLTREILFERLADCGSRRLVNIYDFEGVRTNTLPCLEVPLTDEAVDIQCENMHVLGDHNYGGELGLLTWKHVAVHAWWWVLLD